MSYNWLLFITGLVIGSVIALVFAATGAFALVFVGYVVFPGYYYFFGTVLMICTAIMLFWVITFKRQWGAITKS